MKWTSMNKLRDSALGGADSIVVKLEWLAPLSKGSFISFYGGPMVTHFDHLSKEPEVPLMFTRHSSMNFFLELLPSHRLQNTLEEPD